MARGGSNAIGSAAVILAGNADPLVDELKHGEQSVDRFGQRVGRKLSSFEHGGTFQSGLNLDNFGADLSRGTKLVDHFRSNLWANLANSEKRTDRFGREVGGQLKNTIEVKEPQRQRRTYRQPALESFNEKHGVEAKTKPKERGRGIIPPKEKTPGKLAAINGSGAAGKLGAMFGGVAGATAGNVVGGAGLGFMLGGPVGAVAGGLAGLTVGAAKAGLDIITGLPDTFERLKASATGTNLSVLTGVTNSFDRLEKAGDSLLMKILVPLGPAIAQAADAGASFLDQIGPAFEFAADAGSAFLFVGVEIGTQLATLATETARWAADWIGLSDKSVTGSNLMFSALKMVGEGVGYVWDTFKLGGNVIALVVGKVVEGLGEIVKTTGDAVLMLAKLADQLPESIRPDWIKDAGGLVRGWGDEIDQLGAKWAAWGRNGIDTWGQSAKRFGAEIDAIEAKFNAKRQGLESTPAMMGEPKFAAAITRGSKEAYTIEARHRFGAPNQSSVEKQNEKIIGHMDKQTQAIERLEKAVYVTGENIGSF